MRLIQADEQLKKIFPEYEQFNTPHSLYNISMLFIASSESGEIPANVPIKLVDINSLRSIIG